MFLSRSRCSREFLNKETNVIMSVSYMYLVSVIVFTKFRWIQCDLNFQQTPLSDVVKENNAHTFTCIVSGMQNEQQLIWLKDGKKIIKTDEDLARWTVGNTGNITMFVINRVARNDKGAYTCAVVSKLSGQIYKRSREAILTVNSLPKPQYPICSVSDINVEAESTITLSCTSENIEPEVNLKFMQQSKFLGGKMIVQDDDDLVILQLELKVSKKNDRDTIICQQSSSLLPNDFSTCSVGPLNVRYIPEVIIQHTNPVLPGRETIVFCQTTANPLVTNHRWTFIPTIPENDYITDETGQILKLLRPTIKQNGTRITCTAANNIGEQTSSVTMIVAYQAISSNNDDVAEKTENGEKYQTRNRGISLSLDVVIIIASGVVLIVVLIVLVPIYHYCLCRNNDTATLNASGEAVTQPEVYYESRDGVILRHTIQDRSLPRVPTTEVFGHWRHSTASQVPNDLESHSYTYIDTENE
ncbi:neural cell adhesion molecule 1-like [Anneissia japonica]|uniref:neural cell adhesion molecule 1-like n=1 Tax=Anneissia japonica TaxID=1529436 RepID=UPI0014259ED5|nr:neural cell adhesion molecule 1-like [Anneissia japonica]